MRFNNGLKHTVKLLLIIISISYSSGLYAGGPDSIDDYAKLNSITHEIFGGAEVGITQGPGVITVSADEFPSGSFNPDESFFRTNFQLENKGSLLYSFVLGYNIKPYMGFYFDYINWGEQTLYSIDEFAPLNTTPGFSGSLETFSFGPGMVGYWPFNDGKFDFFVALGIEFVDSTLKFTSPNCTNESENAFCVIPFNSGGYTVVSEYEPAMLSAFGAQVNIGEYFSIRLQYRYMSRFNNSTIANIHYQAFVLGVYGRYSF